MKKETYSNKLTGFLLVVLIKINYWLPQRLSYGLSLIFSKIGFYLNSKTSKTISENINLCFPQLDESQQQNLICQYLKQNARMSGETSIAWLGTKEEINYLLNNISEQPLIEVKKNKSQAVIIAVPHIGNWEFFWHWLQLNHSAISMYSPAKYRQIDQLMLKARSQFGGNPYSTDKKGMLNILKGLKQGEIMMILPDQAPSLGTGIYSPFFGHSTYTMTLLHRLVQKTNAQLLFGTCLRNENNQFDINIFESDFDSQIKDIEQFNQCLNKQIKQLVSTTPEQYLWNYKRFKRQPSGQEIYTSDRLRREKYDKRQKT